MERFESERVSAWRAALTEVTNLPGFDLARNRNESKFIDEIVHEVANLLDRYSLYLEEPLFGIDDITYSINSWVRETSANDCILVIYGISGVGKTTIAKVIFNSNYNDFEGSCFLGDINKKSKSNDLQWLEKEKIIRGTGVGAKKDNETIPSKRHLIVLDDVSDMNQIEVLIKLQLGSQESCTSNKIIITTRRRGLLYDLEDRGHQVRLIEIENLDDDESLALFSWYAFGTYRPLQAYKKQSESMINHCQGLPLALKFLGSSLKNKDIDAWEKTLQKLKDSTRVASSSTKSPLSYDVFLSYRGEDTRSNFICHLEKALAQVGVRTFSNDDAIQKNDLKPKTEREVEQSAISLVVFSENYASSQSCLDELVTIVEHRRSSEHQVIPVFYNVEPLDVKSKRGCYSNAFDWYYNQFVRESEEERKKTLMERVELWKAAVREVADLTGLVLAVGEYESRFIHKIVDEIVKKVDFQPEEKLVEMMLPATGEETKSSSLLQDNICQHFSLGEIKAATQNFDDVLVIGRGGFGNVYKGCIKNGSSTLVAIKRLHSMSDQGAREFWAEVEMLSKLRHCNLVSLIGYCNHRKEMALVYEYMSHGSLEDHLHKAGSTPLSWLQRLKICIGAARGLDYLHTGVGTQEGIIHRDVKSSNILLDENYVGKLSDFGLAKLGPTNQTHTYVSTIVKGTFGYMDPCYFFTGKLTRKSDVYAFGVVLFEVLCGRPAVDTTLDEEQWGLAAWALDHTREGKLIQITDSRLKGQISTNALKEFARIAGRCLHSHPNQRPTMAEVMTTLEFVLSLQQRMESTAVEATLVQKVKSFVFRAAH